jgi:predicted metal-dependent hydrolase
VRRAIQYGDTRIAFTIHFVPSTKTQAHARVRIHVLPSGAVRVDAPESADPAAVVDAVRKRARWVWQQLDAFAQRQRHVLPRQYVSGESHFYLGKRHVLKVLVSSTAQPGVRMWRGRLEVTTRVRDAAVIRALLEAWYRDRAKDVFARRLAEVGAQARWLKALPAFRVVSMRTQWGSCSPKGELLLNPHLVKAPRTCIDYVISHELCHLKEHNHSPEYYRLLSKTLPDWEARKQELDDMAEQILNR